MQIWFLNNSADDVIKLQHLIKDTEWNEVQPCVRITSGLATVRGWLFGVSLLKSIWLNLVWLSCINFPGPGQPASQWKCSIEYYFFILMWSLHSLLYQNQWCRCGVTSSRLRPPKKNNKQLNTSWDGGDVNAANRPTQWHVKNNNPLVYNRPRTWKSSSTSFRR